MWNSTNLSEDERKQHFVKRRAKTLFQSALRRDRDNTLLSDNYQRGMSKKFHFGLALKETECRKFPLVGRKNWNSQEIIQLCERLSGQSARITKIPISALIIFRQLMGFFEWGSNIAERLAFAELLATGEDFTGDMKGTYQLFGFEENETATLEGYMQDYFGRILRKLKELSDEKEKSL